MNYLALLAAFDDFLMAGLSVSTTRLAVTSNPSLMLSWLGGDIARDVLGRASARGTQRVVGVVRAWKWHERRRPTFDLLTRQLKLLLRTTITPTENNPLNPYDKETEHVEIWDPSTTSIQRIDQKYRIRTPQSVTNRTTNIWNYLTNPVFERAVTLDGPHAETTTMARSPFCLKTKPKPRARLWRQPI